MTNLFKLDTSSFHLTKLLAKEKKKMENFKEIGLFVNPLHTSFQPEHKYIGIIYTCACIARTAAEEKML